MMRAGTGMPLQNITSFSRGESACSPRLSVGANLRVRPRLSVGAFEANVF